MLMHIQLKNTDYSSFIPFLQSDLRSGKW